MSDEQASDGPDGIVAFLARWAGPIIMSIAYTMLMVTSHSTSTVKAWITVGFAFVFIVWIVLRYLMGRAALARAVAVGDVDRILAVSDRELARAPAKSPAAARIHLARAFAFELRGDWEAVLVETDAVTIEGPARQEAEARRAGALVELGRVAEARAAVDRLPAPAAVRPTDMDRMIAELQFALARGRVLVAEGKPDEARRALEAIVGNFRATALQRAMAHHYLAKISDPAAAAAHQKEAARFGAGATWLR